MGDAKVLIFEKRLAPHRAELFKLKRFVANEHQVAGMTEHKRRTLFLNIGNDRDFTNDSRLSCLTRLGFRRAGRRWSG